jgi:hypothetical protein
MLYLNCRTSCLHVFVGWQVYGNVQEQLDVIEKEEKENAKQKVPLSLSPSLSGGVYTNVCLSLCLSVSLCLCLPVSLCLSLCIYICVYVSLSVSLSLSRSTPLHPPCMYNIYAQVANLKSRLAKCNPIAPSCPDLEARLVSCLQQGSDPLACRGHLEALVGCTTDAVVVSVGVVWCCLVLCSVVCCGVM